MGGLVKNFIYLFLERGEGREKERERNTEVRDKHPSAASAASHRPPAADLAHNLSRCPDWELNW